MRITYKAVALLASMLLAAPASAADLGGTGGYKDDLSGVVGPCAGVSWTGFRVAGLLGAGVTGTGTGSGTISWGSESITDIPIAGGYRMSTFGAIEIGGDYQFKGSPLVIGAFGDIGSNFAAGSDVAYSVRGRIGLAYGNALLYSFVGVEKAHATGKITNVATGSELVSVAADPTGVAYGLGVDVALGPHWYAGIRWERVNYSAFNLTGSVSNADVSVHTTATDDRGLFTVGYKF
jgi:hypothetical protein